MSGVTGLDWAACFARLPADADRQLVAACLEAIEAGALEGLSAKREREDG